MDQIENDKVQVNRKIRIISFLVFWVLIVQILISYDSLINNFLIHKETKSGYTIFELYENLFLFFPLVSVLFLYRKKAGWILTTFYLSFMLCGIFGIMFPFNMIELVLFYYLLRQICNLQVREIFTIDNRTMFLSIFCGCVTKGCELLFYFFS